MSSVELLTAGTYLMKGTGASAITYTKWFDILNFPDLEGAPEMVDVTNLSDFARRNILGLKSAEAKSFEAPYDETTFADIKAEEGNEVSIAVWLGADSAGAPDGSNGKFEGVGMPSVTLVSGDAGNIHKMRVTFAMTEPFEYVSA